MLQIPDDRVFYKGERIACTTYTGVCAFVQGTEENEGISAPDIKKLTAILVEYGCKGCGSVPTAALDGIDASTTFPADTAMADATLLLRQVIATKTILKTAHVLKTHGSRNWRGGSACVSDEA